jgi:hypothetical protein
MWLSSHFASSGADPLSGGQKACSLRIMRQSLAFVLSLLAGCAAPQPAAPERQPAELAGRTAGAPQPCVPIVRTEALRVSDANPHVLLYGRGRMIWANDLGAGCGFSVHDVLVSELLTRYCRGDLVRSFDGMSRIPGPSCALGDFVPYSR